MFEKYSSFEIEKDDWLQVAMAVETEIVRHTHKSFQCQILF